MGKSRHINDRQMKFAELYAETGNARQSAIQAGYTPNYAAKLKRTPENQAYIREQKDQKRGNRIASDDEILSYLTQVMRGEASATGEAGRMKAAELLGRRYGVFSEQVCGAEAGAPVILDDIGPKAGDVEGADI